MTDVVVQEEPTRPSSALHAVAAGLHDAVADHNGLRRPLDDDVRLPSVEHLQKCKYNAENGDTNNQP